MTRNAKRLATIGAILVSFVLGFAVVSYFRAPPEFPQTVRLPDGTELTILKVSYGTNHVSPALIPKSIFDHLPKKLTETLGLSPRLTRSSSEPTLGLWFKWRNSSPTFPQSNYAITMSDESGFESAGPDLWVGGSRPSVQGETFHSFPRRSPKIHLHAYLPSKWTGSGPQPPTHVGEFEFANPAFAEYPVWKTGPTTVRSSSGDFEATVREFRVGANTNVGPTFRGMYGDNWLICDGTFTAKYRGQIATNWHVKSVCLSDASGNRVFPNFWMNQPPWAAELSCHFGPALWPDGSVWKVSTEFSRLPTSEFQADELVTFKNVPVPAPYAASYGHWKTNLQGLTFTLDGVAGVGATLTNVDQTSLPNKVSEIVATLVPTANSGNLALIRIVSNLGSNIKPEQSYPPIDGKTHEFGVTFPTNTTTVDITFAVHKSRFLEFMLKPEVVGTNQPNAKKR
jgi:hypothetical protein